MLLKKLTDPVIGMKVFLFERDIWCRIVSIHDLNFFGIYDLGLMIHVVDANTGDNFFPFLIPLHNFLVEIEIHNWLKEGF